MLRTQPNGKEPQTWRVTFDEWTIEGCPEHDPTISISDDRRYGIAWFTQGSVRQGLFYAYSDNEGQHFSKPLAFGELKNLPSHPDILAQGKHVILTWTEFDGKQTQLFVMRSNDGGETWLSPKPIAKLSADADFPFLLSNGRGVFVSWNNLSATDNTDCPPITLNNSYGLLACQQKISSILTESCRFTWTNRKPSTR